MGAGDAILLHACCGPCASACTLRLAGEGRRTAVYFANSNIDTEEEFELRRASAQRLAEADGLEFFSAPYDHADWLAKVARGFESEPEKGAVEPLSSPSVRLSPIFSTDALFPAPSCVEKKIISETRRRLKNFCTAENMMESSFIFI